MNRYLYGAVVQGGGVTLIGRNTKDLGVLLPQFSKHPSCLWVNRFPSTPATKQASLTPKTQQLPTVFCHCLLHWLYNRHPFATLKGREITLFILGILTLSPPCPSRFLTLQLVEDDIGSWKNG